MLPQPHRMLEVGSGQTADISMKGDRSQLQNVCLLRPRSIVVILPLMANRKDRHVLRALCLDCAKSPQGAMCEDRFAEKRVVGAGFVEAEVRERPEIGARTNSKPELLRTHQDRPIPARASDSSSLAITSPI